VHCRQRYHHYLMYGISMTAGVFGGLLLTNLVLPGAVDGVKIFVSVLSGVSFWYLTMQGRSLYTSQRCFRVYKQAPGFRTGQYSTPRFSST